MNNSDRDLFKTALSEAMAQKYDEEFSECEENAVCSQKHYDKMQKIIGKDVCTTKKKWSKKTLIAIVVAAALLLTGCTAAYIYRNKIGGFAEEIYEKFISLIYDKGQEDTKGGLEEPYELTYIPEGYEKTIEKITAINVYYKYDHSDGNTISFRQETLYGTHLGFNAEEGYTKIFEMNDGTVIYCRIYDTSCHYVWSDNKYVLNINSTIPISVDELVKIIENIIVKSE